MAPEVLCRVISGEKSTEGIEYQDAKLIGYGRYKLKDRDYPGVVIDANKSVQGKVVKGVDANGLNRLDYFEGPEYDREEVTVETSEGEVKAWAYIWKDKSILLDEEWDFNGFVDGNLEKWVADELEQSEGMGGRFWKTE